MASDTRRPLGEAIVQLLPSAFRGRTDDSGRFEIGDVPEGEYLLQVLRIGFTKFSEPIVVPLHGHAMEIGMERLPDIDLGLCFFERELAAEPALTLARTDSVVVERDYPDGSRLRHIVVARGSGDRLTFESRIMNIGHSSAMITILCYPSASAIVLKSFRGIGPTCYGMSHVLAAAASMRVSTRGILRGQPGRYRFHVHAIDPASTDAWLDLDVVPLKP